MKKEKTLTLYYELWKNLNDYLNSREDYSLKAALALTTVASAFLVVDNESDLRIILYYISPLIMILILSYISCLFRFVAVLRGYLSALEEKINDMLDDQVFMWNGTYVKLFISNNIPNIIIMVCAIGIALGVIIWIIISVFLGEVKLNDASMFSNILSDSIVEVINYLYYPSLMVMLVLLILSFMDNNYIIKTSRELFINKSEVETIEEIKKLYSLKLNIFNRCKWY